MADKDAKERLRSLAEVAANFHPDSHIPSGGISGLGTK